MLMIMILMGGNANASGCYGLSKPYVEMLVGKRRAEERKKAKSPRLSLCAVHLGKGSRTRDYIWYYNI